MVKNYNFTERPLSQEKNLQLNVNNPDDFDAIIRLGKALGNADCMRVFKYLSIKPMNLLELSKLTDLPVSSVSNHVDRLRDAQLIFINYQPGLKGHAKICSKQLRQITLLCDDVENPSEKYMVKHELPVGAFSDCDVSAPCGMAGSEKILIPLDNPALFFHPERLKAELLWFSEGYITYKFPNDFKKDQEPEEISFSMEICSEAIYYREKYPSDITIEINDVEIVTWTSPGDFGGRRGTFSPSYWSLNSTQFGLLQEFSVNRKGVFINHVLSNPKITIRDLRIPDFKDVKLTIRIKEDAVHKGGINIFGKNFGNYDQAIIMTIK